MFVDSFEFPVFWAGEHVARCHIFRKLDEQNAELRYRALIGSLLDGAVLLARDSNMFRHFPQSNPGKGATERADQRCCSPKKKMFKSGQ